MSAAIAFALPDGVPELVEGLDAFLKAEVFTRYDKHHDLFDNPRRIFLENGQQSPEIVELQREVRMASAAAGYYNLAVPESMGGGGMGHVAYYACLAHMFHACGPHRWLGQSAVSHWAFGPSAVLDALTPEGNERVLTDMMTGRTIMCFGMSEPDAGSDAARLRSTAVAQPGGGWVLNGRKIWTSNAPTAEWIIALAITDPELAGQRKGGISAFMVPMKASGVRVERIIRMWGEIGGLEAEVSFDDVHIEPWQLVGDLHKGFKIGVRGVSLGRIFNSARGYGLGRWSLDTAIEYTKHRVAFDKPIMEYQGVAFPLAESATELHAAHLLALNAASLLDAGKPAIKELSMAKMFAVQAGARAADRAIQTHGAMGLTNELGLTEAYTHLRNVNIADGTNQILLRTIFNRLATGDTDL